ncbi:hypothetical protein AA15973_2880 [Komagataeibacter sucrofermentans DSM 15973]|nr:hypothetical protein AA15973_2880 [Komagataeibacter sucrofermentans DSM 15973]
MNSKGTREDAQSRHETPADIFASEIMPFLFDDNFSCMNSWNGKSALGSIGMSGFGHLSSNSDVFADGD